MQNLKVLMLFFLATSVFSLSSCLSDLIGVTGKGDVLTEERNVTTFDGIELLGAADIEIVKGNAYKVEVSDYENLTEFIAVEVTNKLLTIKKNPGTQIIFNSKAKIYITLPDPLYTITLGGTGDIYLKSAFDNLKAVKIMGSGDIFLTENAQYNDIKFTLIGVGSIDAKGSTDKLTANITGKGNLNLALLKANSADCYISGSGNIYVDVNDMLKATISGTGLIEYSGNPVVNTTITGTGSVKHK